MSRRKKVTTRKRNPIGSSAPSLPSSSCSACATSIGREPMSALSSTTSAAHSEDGSSSRMTTSPTFSSLPRPYVPNGESATISKSSQRQYQILSSHLPTAGRKDPVLIWVRLSRWGLMRARSRRRLVGYCIARGGKEEAREGMCITLKLGILLRKLFQNL